MNRRHFIKTLGGGIMAATTTAGNMWAQHPEKPNVLLIISDDLNDAVAGMGGYPRTITPNMQKLMNNSVVFGNAHSNNPICAPSRASFLTGIYPHKSG